LLKQFAIWITFLKIYFRNSIISLYYKIFVRGFPLDKYQSKPITAAHQNLVRQSLRFYSLLLFLGLLFQFLYLLNIFVNSPFYVLFHYLYIYDYKEIIYIKNHRIWKRQELPTLLSLYWCSLCRDHWKSFCTFFRCEVRTVPNKGHFWSSCTVQATSPDCC
jgi:hypothetical protein